MSVLKKRKQAEFPEEPELVEKITELRDQIAEKALNVVHVRLPKLVLHLDTLAKEDPNFTLNYKDLEHLDLGEHAASAMDDGKDKETVQHSPVPCNQTIVNMLNLMKAELLDLIDMTSSVKIWIQLNIPRIEDGNNFGVGIQEEAVNELGRAEDSAFTILQAMTKYFISRAKLVSKALKYPHIKDYTRSIIELDEKQFINVSLCAVDLRNNASILYDLIHKNLEKIKQPRTTHHLSTML
mmetsp:Transcript_52558/g.132193  ORF Transcript_52558/g.132193 Transcript_52558/m.132193 type:complete len:239 (-) Transcript_52558:137-853(-)|eukprot:CAMPEP_0177647906 /NCGR_PEP_ID=MMETSP0447-20121125/10546_1 /TAXON_ID=0 /ORGANISM="Stygamoeba regulata, Strain BSH-02190019" /LENGTH=238 /DNA_ID=CAMNT_0019150515 /DNA_START=79 /DNA_END=795 /DNA_ORIENTATION=+